MSDTSPGTYTGRQATDKILHILAEVEKPLPSYMEFYYKILMTQAGSKIPDISEATAMLRENAEQRLKQATPALTFPDLSIDWQDTLVLFCEVVELTLKFVAQEAGEKENLAVCCESADILEHTAKLWFETGTVPHNNTEHRKTIQPLTSSVLQATFYPVLSVYADILFPVVTQDRWQKGYCPVCGGYPDFSFLDKERGARWLLCSRCDNRWLFKRLECPFCGNDDHTSLAYFTDDHGTYRLYTCDKCYRYIKAIDLRQMKEEALLPLQRVLTLDMDRQAHEMKYKAEL
ncbi:MAG: formate dehydrogenase accessory protein FdhE [Dehalococcoidia bacterium]